MRKFYTTGIVMLFALLGVTMAAAAQNTCPSIVQEALTQLANSCESLGRNEACYGNGEIVALDAQGTQLSEFDTVGDIADLLNLSNLALSGLDESENVWGLAVLSIQANIPNTIPGQNVTVLIFGDSELKSTDDASAYLFNTGVGQFGCDEAPNGMLIQTPEGVGEINLTINNISIELGSTAYITAEAGGEFTFALLEGNANLDNGANSVEVAGGEFTTVALDEDLSPEGDFAEVQPIEDNLVLPQLPISVLPRDISDEFNNEVPETGGSANTGQIIPQNGTWHVVMGELVAESCPAMMTDAFSSGLMSEETIFVDFGGENWDFETFFLNETGDNTGGTPMDGTFTSPELNVYQYEFNDEIIFRFVMQVISETSIEGYYYFDASAAFAGCKMTIPYTLEIEE